MIKTCVCGNNMTKAEWKHQWVCHHCGRTKPININQTNADTYFHNAVDNEIFQKIRFSLCPPVYKCYLDKSCEDCWLEWLKREGMIDE